VTVRALKAVWPLVALLVPLAVLVLLLGLTAADVQSSAIGALINMVIVVGLYIFVGNSGVLSFGHVSFVSIGAYATALLTMTTVGKGILLPHLPGILANAELGTVPALAVSAAGVGVLAYLVAVPLMRLNGIAASIATLSLLVIVQVVLQNWEDVTGGSGTLTGVPVDTTLGGVLAWVCLACAVAYAYQRSRAGRRLRASREDEPAARSVGVRVERERRLAFTLSAVVVAVGGGLYGHFLGSLSPGAMYLQLTFVTLAMLVVGGMGSLAGAVVGTVVVSVITEVLGRFEEGGLAGLHVSLRPGIREMVVAVLTMVILVWRSTGLTRSREIPWPGRRGRAADATAGAPVAEPDAPPVEPVGGA